MSIILKTFFLYLSSLLVFMLSTFTVGNSKEKSDLFRLQLQLEQMINESYQYSIFNDISTHEQSSYSNDVTYDLISEKATVLSHIEILFADFLYHEGQIFQGNEEMLIEVLNDESFGDGGFNFGYSGSLKYAHYLFVSQLTKSQNSALLEHEDANYFAVVVPDSDLLSLIISSSVFSYFSSFNFFNKREFIYSNKALPYLQEAITQFSCMSLLILLYIFLLPLFIQRCKWLNNLTVIVNMSKYNHFISNKFDTPSFIRKIIKAIKNISIVIYSIKKSINIQFLHFKINRGIL
ncbi:hypothetical protein [Cysteiniphilum marinum]|uniref:hypothetical protein n=1 Tax=Cysteiniphilum marinum TaxID=2774191 RepID=UPI00193BF217|nr:hypothetical protein [Cysteiniphilum marinum]